MKRLIILSDTESETLWPSSYFILKYQQFNINCREISRNVGLFKDGYLLELEGSKDNIEKYISYLKDKGFKVH